MSGKLWKLWKSSWYIGIINAEVQKQDQEKKNVAEEHYYVRIWELIYYFSLERIKYEIKTLTQLFPRYVTKLKFTSK